MTAWMGWPWHRRAGRAGGTDATELTMALRFELAGEEERALAASYALSMALGVAWLALVRFGPMIAPLEPKISFVTPDSVFSDSFVVDFIAPNDPRSPTDRRVHKTVDASRGAGGFPRAPGGAGADDARRRAIAGAFRAYGSGIDPSTILRNVDVTPGGALVAEGARAPKAVIAGGGRGGEGRPGFWEPRARRGGEAGGIATVGGGDLAREAARVVAPPVVEAPSVGTLGNAAELGHVARSRGAELESCYQREGRSRQPTLAGAITVELAINADGRVTDARIVRRTWTGDAARATEACVLSAVRRWRFPQASDRATFAVPLSFTSSG